MEQLLINNSKIIFTIIIIAIIFFFLINTHKEKVNVTDIIKKHISTLKLFGGNKIEKNDINLFFIMPIFIALLILMYINIDDTRIGIIVTAFTIFIGLLFNILAILLAFDGERNRKLDREYMRQVLYNVSFSIIVAIVVIVISMLRFINFKCYIYYVLDFILIYLVCVFILSLFMVLKRLFNLLVKKIDEI
ncbi:hypothetical protein GZ979_001275 [Clostridium perfringens]